MKFQESCQINYSNSHMSIFWYLNYGWRHCQHCKCDVCQKQCEELKLQPCRDGSCKGCIKKKAFDELKPDCFTANYFLRRAAVKKSIIAYVRLFKEVGVTGSEIAENILYRFYMNRVHEWTRLSAEIQRMARKLAAKGLIYEQAIIDEDDNTVTYLYLP